LSSMPDRLTKVKNENGHPRRAPGREVAMDLRSMKPEQRLAEIEARRTSRGGFTRETLEIWGVPWPPPKGWKEELVSTGGFLATGRDRAVK
jgi:hypothetical protein